MTSDTHNLLVELFVEELPPKALKKLGDSFAGVLAESLRAQGLATAESQATAYASPRRLALHLSGVAAKAADRSETKKLVPVSVGLDASGQPTQALIKKLASWAWAPSRPPRLIARWTARPRPCSSRPRWPAPPWPRACRRPWKRAWPSCPFPRS